MAFIFTQSTTQNFFNDITSQFFSVVNKLKAHNALPQDCFLEEVPFFNLPLLPKEMQLKELFENACDLNACKHLLKNVAPLSEGAECNLVPQNFSSISVMTLAQIVLYKVLPCPYSNCTNCPREIATHNQYKDFEYECPFYHHDKDRRRLVLFDGSDEDFAYKANYFEEGRRKGDKEGYSQNYFESMFHPLYYKMFRCKRDFCNSSAFCPFFHCEGEKNTWDRAIMTFIGKDRSSYVKDKPQRNAQKKQRAPGAGRRLSDEETTPSPQFYSDNRAYLKQYKPRQEEAKNYFEKSLKKPMAYRKDSESSSEENQNNNGFFSKLQASSMSFSIY